MAGERKQKKATGIWRCFRVPYKLFSSHVGLTAILLAYSFAGAAMFQAIEGRHERLEKLDVLEMRKDVIQKLWNSSVKVKVDAVKFSKLVETQLKLYEGQLYKAFGQGISTDVEVEVWDFWQSLFYCATVYTTIEKLLEAMEDPSPILHWSSDGKAIVANEKLFEEKIMKRYPGLVQISSFLNFRRQLREYGFDWAVMQTGEFHFSHPCFLRERPELIRGVATKRKSFGGGHSLSTTAMSMTTSEGGIRGRCRTRAVSRLVNTSRSAPTQIEVVGVKGRRDDRGLSDGAPVKIIKLAVGNVAGSNDGDGASPGTLDAWSLCSTPPRMHGLAGLSVNSGGSGTYPATRVYATRYNTRIRELRDRTPETLSSSVAANDDDPAHAFAATTLASPHCNNWWTYCAPWGPGEEVHETLPETGATTGATGPGTDQNSSNDGYRCIASQRRPSTADIPVYFYDDDKPANLAQLVNNDDWQFGLDGQPRATPVDVNLSDWDCHEMRYYYAL